MKKIIYSFSFFIGLVMCLSTANAATYTAVANGNWTSAATWGGTAPGNDLSFDNVVIPAGLTVTLDTDVEFSGGLLFSIQVNGTLSSSSNSELILSSGSLTGNGTIDLYYFEVSGLSTIAFTGDFSVEQFRSNTSLPLTFAAHLSVSDSLILEGGAFTMGSGSNLAFETDAVVKVDGGTIVLNGGILTGSNAYHVLYTGTSATAGVEATWAGFTDLMIDMDNDNQTLSLGTDVVVNGEIKQMSGWLDLNGNDLTINGNYNNTSTAGIRGDAGSSLMINSTADWTSDLWFEDGAENLDNLHLNMGDETSLNLASDLSIHGNLTLEKGELKVTGGSSLIMEDNSIVLVNEGSISTDNGVFNGTNDYSVRYIGSATETGIEMSGAGLQNLMVSLDDEEGTVKLMNNYTINGELQLMNGILDLNENNLTLSGGFERDENGFLKGNENSNLNINGNASWSDTLHFADGGQVLDQLSINLTGGTYMMLGTDLTVNDLNLNNGSVLIFDNTLTLASGGTITGYSQNNYVMIDGGGQLQMEMTSGGSYTTFPVGTTDGYSPAMVQYNSGSTTNFMVGVEEGVYAVGTYGDDLSESESIVNRTWTINSEAGETSDIDMKVWWSQAMEVNGFNRTNARISGFIVDEGWDYSAMGSAVTTSNGMYEMSRDDVSNLGRFAVTDANSALEIPQNDALISGVFPNPADEKLNISVGGAAEVQLIDAYGKVVSVANVIEAGIVEMNLTSLPSGMYVLRANANGAFTTQKVIKK